MERYLDGEQVGVSVPPATATSLPPLFLLGGDSDDNDIVNILDLSFMGARYGLWWFDAGWDEKADINDDGTINIQDIVLGGSNYLQTSPVPWP
jgi:hypothetical protein